MLVLDREDFTRGARGSACRGTAAHLHLPAMRTATTNPLESSRNPPTESPTAQQLTLTQRGSLGAPGARDTPATLEEIADLPTAALIQPPLISEPFHREGWVYEEKRDGYGWSRTRTAMSVREPRRSLPHRAAGLRQAEQILPTRLSWFETAARVQYGREVAEYPHKITTIGTDLAAGT